MSINFINKSHLSSGMLESIIMNWTFNTGHGQPKLSNSSRANQIAWQLLSTYFDMQRALEKSVLHLNLNCVTKWSCKVQRCLIFMFKFKSWTVSENLNKEVNSGINMKNLEEVMWMHSANWAWKKLSCTARQCSMCKSWAASENIEVIL